MVEKLLTTADMALDPIVKTIKPMTVFNVPDTTSVAFFFCSSSPIRAITPMMSAVFRHCAMIASITDIFSLLVLLCVDGC